MRHQEQDARNLALHVAVVALLKADETLIEHALELLTRQDTQRDGGSECTRGEWVRIMHERDWIVALSVNERANRLRQGSILPRLLPKEQYLEIIRTASRWMA
jgi:hypothetical protein